jgi:hypothetical protein
VFNEWSKLDPEQRTTDRILQMLDFDFFELLDSVTIARSRKHIQAFYDTTEIGAFPERRPPLSIREPLTDLPDVPGFNDIFEQLQALTLAVYTPLAYVFPSRRSKYEDLYNVTAGQRPIQPRTGRPRAGLEEAHDRQPAQAPGELGRCLPPHAGKIEGSVTHTLGRISNHAGNLADLSPELAGSTSMSMTRRREHRGAVGREDQDRPRRPRHRVLAARPVERPRDPARAPRRDAQGHPDHDLKLRKLKQVIADKAGTRSTTATARCSCSRRSPTPPTTSTANSRPRSQRAGLDTAVITGGSHGAKTTLGTGFDFQQVMSLFSPRSKQRHLTMPRETRELDVLIGTDVISEGQNLQDCDYLINYDIHWNPVRIIQRFGRIDRIGSTNSQIQLVNFWPDISLDEYINLKERVENRMVIADLASTADDNVLTLEESDAAFRKEQLRKLQDEVIELEDVRTGVSITDLGLNDFRMDLLGYIKEYGDLAPHPAACTP